MKILYHNPNPSSVYAGRTILAGYEHAFIDTGHTFDTLTPQDSMSQKLLEDRPDIFFTSLTPLSLKFIDLDILHEAKKNGTNIFVNTPFWNSPLSKQRVTETPSLKDNSKYIELINSGKYGDVYYSICEQGDERMIGFEQTTGYQMKTLLLAADKSRMYPEYDQAYKADISYIGTLLPEKKDFFTTVVFPLRESYDVKIYGQDWTLLDKSLGYVQKIGQYFNISPLATVRKPALPLDAERKIYTSSVVSINVHEQYQRQHGDLNERTFKIPLSGGFQIVDEVSTLRKYFSPKELVSANSKKDWLEKLDYFIRNPEQRIKYIQKAQKKVQKLHTYHNRVTTLIGWYKDLHEK